MAASRHTYIHPHNFRICSHASVGLAQAPPNYVYIHIYNRPSFAEIKDVQLGILIALPISKCCSTELSLRLGLICGLQMCEYLISFESMSPTLNVNSATRCFKRGDAIKIGRGIIHTQDCHIYIYICIVLLVKCTSCLHLLSSHPLRSMDSLCQDKYYCQERYLLTVERNVLSFCIGKIDITALIAASQCYNWFYILPPIALIFHS